MKSYALFQQYIWLVNTIHKAGKISLEELNRKWLDTEMSEGVDMARSTFNRHKDAIEEMFGLYIECDRSDGFRYYIGNDDVLSEDSIQNWMLSTLSVGNVISESRSVHERILLESIPSGGENLSRFIEAMKRSVRIRVRYRGHDSDGASQMLVDPLFLKLFGRRWYGIVRLPIKTGAFTLALDRMESLELSEEKFTYDVDFTPEGYFSDVYGIFRDTEIPLQRVVIRAFGREADRLKDLPLHHSQKALGSTPDYTDFELTLRPTGDFLSALLFRGPAIKVLEPQPLADEVKRHHLAAAELYR